MCLRISSLPGAQMLVPWRACIQMRDGVASMRGAIVQLSYASCLMPGMSWFVACLLQAVYWCIMCLK